MTTPDDAAPTAEVWYRRSADEALQRFRSSPAGLSTADAAARLAANGPNALKDAAPVRPWTILLGQFKSLIIWVLIAAGVVSGALGEMVDAGAILAIVALNAAIGFYQEYNAARSIAALGSLTAPHAAVLRDGAVASVAAAGVVVGDVLALEAGDLVAADARLLSAASLKCIESALTGESEAVSKDPAPLPAGDVALGDRANMVFMGTSVTAGTGRAVVVAAAMDTELGRIAGLMEAAGADEATPLQKRLDAFGRVLVWVTLGVVALLFALGLARGTRPLEMFMTSVSLAVAAVPEGLPAIVTVALALGVQRMARRRALVRKLAAVEALGSTTVICTDKTGTLTVGEMTARTLHVDGRDYEVTGEGYGPKGEVRLGGAKVATPALLELATVLVACNHAHLVEEGGAWKTVGDPTEGALLAAGAKAGADRARVDLELPVVHEVPFDSDRKRSAVVRRQPDGALRAYVNGAPGPLLACCTQLFADGGVRPLTADDRTRLLALTTSLASRALRVLGSARRDLGAAPAEGFTAESIERELVFVGLTGMYDPPRAEAKGAIAVCGAAGVRVVMITGDHPETAAAIARELGIPAGGEAVVTGVALDAMSKEELERRAPAVAAYARVTAEHKLRIVRALKAGGAVVAMTGDGVNDAPAIRGADVGIAMGRSGTEVTRQAADMIITDDNFTTIVAAVEEGRGIYDNIRKTLQYLLAGNAAELLLMTACLVVGLPAPLLPIHLLWINLVTDGLPALCLATDPIDADVMQRAPRAATDRITNRPFLYSMALTGLLTAAVTFAVYVHALRAGGTATARTEAFAVLVFAELLRAFGARSETKPVWRIRPLFDGRLVGVVLVSIALQVGSQHSAALGRLLGTAHLPFGDGLALLALGSIPFAALELVKLVRGARSDARKDAPPGARGLPAA
jgi:Ca2+-transporting ATPase